MTAYPCGAEDLEPIRITIRSRLSFLRFAQGQV